MLHACDVLLLTRLIGRDVLGPDGRVRGRLADLTVRLNRGSESHLVEQFAPLVTILVGTQVLNAVLLVPLLLAMVGLARDRDLMGSFVTGRAGTLVYAVTTVVVVVCVITLGITTLLG
jgi:hypothetical protein